MPKHKNDYEDAEEYIDDNYRPEDNEDLEFNELTAKEQEDFIRGTFFKGVSEPRAKMAAYEMRKGLARPYGQRRGRNRINLRGHIHHIIRGLDGRIKKWLD